MSGSGVSTMVSGWVCDRITSDRKLVYFTYLGESIQATYIGVIVIIF